MQKIFVIGDSHSYFFGGNENIGGSSLVIGDKIFDIQVPNQLIYNFFPIHLGPALAYNLVKYGSKTQAREKIDFLINTGIIPVGSEVLCAFGEIDSRVHVLRKAVEHNIDFRIVVDEILERYVKFLNFLSQRNVVYVWGPIPTQKDNSPINPAYPYFGTERDRNIATEYFNERLNIVCEANGWKFFSIFKNLIDENYKTRSEFIADGCHLSQRAWLFALDEFKRKGIHIFFTDTWTKILCDKLAQIARMGGGSGFCNLILFLPNMADFFYSKLFFATIFLPLRGKFF